MLHGCLEQLYTLKKQNRNLKVLLSIGGATYSSNFAQPVSTLSGRSKFASSTISLIQELGLDGIDINWVNITGDTQAENFASLVQAVRNALDTYTTSLCPRYNFTLTVACPAGPWNYKILHLREMNQHVDFWNLMAYDYTGSWSPVTSH
jgi:chitinase